MGLFLDKVIRVVCIGEKNIMENKIRLHNNIPNSAHSVFTATRVNKVLQTFLNLSQLLSGYVIQKRGEINIHVENFTKVI